MSSDLYAISLVVIINVYTNREEFFSTIAMTGTKLHKIVHYMEFLYIFAARTRIHWYPVGYYSSQGGFHGRFSYKMEIEIMYWTLELASSLDDAPWPASKDELIDYANRSGAPEEVIENLQELEDDGEVYESIEDIWPDYPTKEDYFFNEEEY